jgi:hypothetical protein
MEMTTKYEKAVLPDKETALAWAIEREAWAERASDKPGSAHEFELTALLLRRYYAEGKTEAKLLLMVGSILSLILAALALPAPQANERKCGGAVESLFTDCSKRGT